MELPHQHVVSDYDCSISHEAKTDARAWKIAPALAVGCTIVMKPSELTPLTALVRLCTLVLLLILTYLPETV